MESKGVLIRVSSPIHDIKTLHFTSKGYTANVVALEIHFNTFFFRTKQFNFKSEFETIKDIYSQHAYQVNITGNNCFYRS